MPLWLPPSMTPLWTPSRMRRGWSRPSRQLAAEEGRAEAVAPDVDEELRAAAGPEGVAVHADDAGHRTAIGVERGRAVVGFDLIGEAPLVIEGDHARVVVEDGEEPRAPGHQFFRGSPNVGLEK